jgi:hypothetical protein
MLEIRNNTPFKAAIIPGLDKEGYDYATVVIKGTFNIRNKESISVSDEQVPITFGDKYWGEPESSSLKYASDTSLTKPGTDVVLNGHAYSRHGKKAVVDVHLQVGPVKKTIFVFGERRWFKELGSWHISNPIAYEKKPLVYEGAFGGIDKAHSNPAKHGFDNRNPIGTGFCLFDNKDHLDGLRLPNLENPNELIKHWKDKPIPVGFGFIAPHWQTRKQYAGTYDDFWKTERCPLLPTDFNDSFFNCAHPDLISKKYLSGGEAVQIKNASKDTDLSFNLPEKQFVASIAMNGEQKEYIPNIDTVVLEPDENRVMLVWRVAVQCFKQFLYIDRIEINER